MSQLQDKIYKLLPDIGHNTLITLYDYRQAKHRYGGNFQKWIRFYEEAKAYSLETLKAKQAEMLREFLIFSQKHSEYYRHLYKDIDFTSGDIWELYEQLPILSKEDVRSNIEKIYTCLLYTSPSPRD